MDPKSAAGLAVEALDDFFALQPMEDDQFVTADDG